MHAWAKSENVVHAWTKSSVGRKLKEEKKIRDRCMRIVRKRAGKGNRRREACCTYANDKNDRVLRWLWLRPWRRAVSMTSPRAHVRDSHCYYAVRETTKKKKVRGDHGASPAWSEIEPRGGATRPSRFFSCSLVFYCSRRLSRCSTRRSFTRRKDVN